MVGVWRSFFSRMKLSIVCHGYWWTAHTQSVGWFVGSEHKGTCFLKHAI